MIPSFDLAPGIPFGAADAFPVVTGPCVIEGEDWLVEHALSLKAMGERLGIPLIFKSSFDKANRSSLTSFRGPGLTDGLKALATVKAETGMPLLTDVHSPGQCEKVAEVVDVLQVPAFLCRQTDLVVAAAETGKPVLIKKGQFMAPQDMTRIVDKARSAGNDKVGVTERGASFGYHNLVVDMRGFDILRDAGIAVLYDVTHSLQLPGAGVKESGGDRRFARSLTLAAIAAGAAGLYLEVHPDPDQARCDSATQLPTAMAEDVLIAALKVRAAVSA